MAGEPPAERRRTTRVDVAGAAPAAINLTLHVRLINLSTSGVLLRSRHPLTAGSRITLRVMLGNEVIAIPVEIRGNARKPVDDGENGPYEFGGAIAFGDETGRLHFERLLEATLKPGNPGTKES